MDLFGNIQGQTLLILKRFIELTSRRPDLLTTIGVGRCWRASCSGWHGATDVQRAEPPCLRLLAAHLLISPAAEVVEGQMVTLSCRSGLSPTPDIRFSWYLNGALLLEGPSSSLLIPAASSTDAGSYYCRAQDSHSASGPSSPAVLTVLCEQPPHWPLPVLGRMDQSTGVLQPSLPPLGPPDPVLPRV